MLVFQQFKNESTPCFFEVVWFISSFLPKNGKNIESKITSEEPQKTAIKWTNQ